MTRMTILLIAAACTADPHIEPPPAWTVQQQHDAAVLVQPCGGTGVAIGSGFVLTASHVACDVDLSNIVDSSGVRFPVHRLAWRDNDHDLAMLLTDLSGQDPVPDTAAVGDAVCAEVAVPARARRCGRVTRIDPVGTPHGFVDLWIDIQTVAGNSGAGLYDDYGHLIGVLTDGVDGIGLASSVYGRLQR